MTEEASHVKVKPVKRARYRQTSKFIVDGKALSDARCAKNISMKRLAEMLGCSKGHPSKWEQETLVPSEERIFKMAEILGTWAFVKGNPNYRGAEK